MTEPARRAAAAAGTAGDFARDAGERLDGTPLLVMLDVDGTLAPIAPTPAEARVPDATAEALRTLVRLPGVTLALVSGRAAADTWRLAGVDGAWVLGNHGFEIRAPDGALAAAEAAAPYGSAIAQAAERLVGVEREVPGALVENKRWTISLHYRQVAAADVTRLLERAHALAESLGLRVTQGKKIAELRPPVRIDKGTASLDLARRLGALAPDASVMYAGDDRTDEDAFRALRAASDRAVTVHVMASPNEHLDPPTIAEISVAGLDDLRNALEWLVQRRTSRAT